MGQKDIISKHLLKRLALDMARILLKLVVDDVEVVETQMQRVEERRADLVVKARTGIDEYLLHIEIQNNNQTIMPWRMLRYRTDIRFEHPELAIQQYLLYIGKEQLTMASNIDEPQLDYRYHVLDMHTIDCETLLCQDNPDALVIAILADFGKRSERDVVRHILQRLDELTAGNEATFREYVLMLEVLSSNRDLKDLIEEEEEMLSQVRYSDLPSYGLGERHGIQKGIQQGEVSSLLRLLRLKFGELPEELIRNIEKADIESLSKWFDKAVTAISLDEAIK